MFLLYVCAHKWLLLSTSAPDDCLLICALGYFACSPLFRRGCWSGVMIVVCHLVMGLFPCRTSFIMGTECTYFGPLCPRSPGLQVTWIAGNLWQCLQPLGSAQSVQARTIPLHCLLLLTPTIFLPSFYISICLLSDVGKKQEQTIC